MGEMGTDFTVHEGTYFISLYGDKGDFDLISLFPQWDPGKSLPVQVTTATADTGYTKFDTINWW